MKNTKTTLTIDAYNKNAENYASKFSDYSPYKKQISAFQKSSVPKGAKILDLGCGPGQNLRLMQKEDPDCICTGIDLSSEFISIAKKLNPEATFIHNDLRHFTAEEKYDVIIASFCIVHLTNNETEKLIDGISKSLGVNGSLYLSFMEGNSSGFETTSFSKEKIFFNYYPERDIVLLLKKYGLNTIEIKKEDYPEPDGSVTTDIFITAKKAAEPMAEVYLFDWGDTLMVNFPDAQGKMCDWKVVEAVEGAEEALKYLSETAEIYIATGASDSSEKDIMRAFERAGLAQYISGYFCRENTGCKKGEPEFLKHILQRLGKEAHRITMVGDSFTSDIEPALKENMGAIWFQKNNRSEQNHPVRTISTLRELVFRG